MQLDWSIGVLDIVELVLLLGGGIYTSFRLGRGLSGLVATFDRRISACEEAHEECSRCNYRRPAAPVAFGG